MKYSRLHILTAAAAAVLCILVSPQFVRAEEEDPAHEELRALRKGVVEAIEKGDIEGQIKYAHPDIVVTWQNNEVCRGHGGLREFYERMGKDAFKGYKVPPEADGLTVLYGTDTGVASGRTVGTYKVLGKELEFHNRWTATLVKEDGKWLIASYHVSLNALDNPILNAAAKSLYLGIGGGLLVGLLIGFLVGRRRRKK